MQLKTNAIVLKIQKIKDNASLIHLYTQETGRATYLLYGAQSKRKGNALSFLHPLSIVSIDINLRNSRELNIINEIKQEEATMELLFNPIKSSLAFFIAEILLQVLRTNEKDDTLFEFLCQSILKLDRETKNLGNFHIAFLLRLSGFLGFQPSIDTPYTNVYFDLKQMEFTSQKPEHQYFLRSYETEKMKLLLRMNYRNFHLYHFTKSERSEVIDRILQYYKIHTQSFGEIKSLYVLKEIFE